MRTLLSLSLLLLLIAPALADGAQPPGAGGASGDPEVFPDSAGATGSGSTSGTAIPGGQLAGASTTDAGSLDLTALAKDAGGPRLKDIGKVGGLRINQLYGLGLVVGLAGTGDDSRLTQQMAANYLQRQDLPMPAALLKGKNATAVTLTAVLPAFVQPGDQLDVLVSAMGNTKSLDGGVLLLSPLKAANGEVIALAQGPLTLGAFGGSAGQGGARAGAQKNFLTAARIPDGALVERAVRSDLPPGGRFHWVLKEPDFTTAQRAAAALNRALPGSLAIAEDAQRIALQPPATFRGSFVDFLAQVEQVPVLTDMPMRIVINERNGTIVAGAGTKIKPVSIAHGSLTVSIREGFAVSQPDTPFGGGATAITPGAGVEITEDGILRGEVTTVQDLLDAVTSAGGGIRDAVAILQALKAAGAIDAELLVI